MSRTFQRPFPQVARQIRALGERLRDARLRRRVSTILFADRMGVSRDTLNRLEKGDPTIALGTYVRALRVLGLDKDLDALARDDALGRKLQDLKLPARKPGSRRTKISGAESEPGSDGLSKEIVAPDVPSQGNKSRGNDAEH